jgi:hypothetical protein
MVAVVVVVVVVVIQLSYQFFNMATMCCLGKKLTMNLETYITVP